MKLMPKIDKVMTTLPHTVGKDIPLKKAQSMMREYGIRHLPVLEGSELVGVLTDRDIKVATSFQGPGELVVGDVMTQDPFSVLPDRSLDEVVAEMAEHKYGCAVVRQGNGKVVGIFTAVDGLRVLSEIMRQHYRQAS